MKSKCQSASGGSNSRHALTFVWHLDFDTCISAQCLLPTAYCLFLTVAANPYLLTVFLHRADTTPGGHRRTHILTVGDQEVIDRNPVPPRKYLSKGKLGLPRGPGTDITQTVRYPVDVGINAYTWFTVSNGYYQVGRLPPHTVQFKQLLQGIWYLPMILVHKDPGNLFYPSGLCLIETYWVNCPFYGGDVQGGHLLRALSQAKQPFRGLGGDKVFGAETQQTGHQHLKYFRGISTTCNHTHGRFPVFLILLL